MSMSHSGPDNKFKVELCEVGDCESCLFSYCCSCCAIAQARSYVDNSPPIFNFCCVNHVVERWLIRSAYDIPGDACSDCYTTVFCPCCVANQAYQTSKDRGNPVNNGGRYANVNPFITKLPPSDATVQQYAYSCCCMPCAMGDTMEHTVGMPWYMGCCCVNAIVGRNVMRYQYRLKGDDVKEEMVVPCCAHVATNILSQIVPCAGCFLWSAYAAVVTQLNLESKNYPPATGPYLGNSSAPPLPPTGGVVVTPTSMVNQPVMGHPTQQTIQMGVIQQGPPSIPVYTHQNPVVGNSIPMPSGGPNGYGRVTTAEPIKEY